MQNIEAGFDIREPEMALVVGLGVHGLIGMLLQFDPCSGDGSIGGGIHHVAVHRGLGIRVTGGNRLLRLQAREQEKKEG